ncbi:UTP--glucose-1-phosphate uridylyltransferase [Haematospirillum sp. H1815]|uniref:UTP--glucose-1-phosphate uridylyltransferase n=1 Tax=Haematospirillum sp. H1815 TaxID=2723108 RepID=UPI001438CA84|nr:UTP--glucose-1-phosphate uridylyltransferase [Haematospirillum sp. H1815]NKD77813.1 UTP--glucose-1-phosphate uridylyltransferase [Haematospirillum sp. H1815]
MTRRVRKAVFPVAGLGTRFLPATKLVAKEMLPVVDKPLIQYAVEEAWKAGIEYCLFVTGRGKAVLVDHFDHAPELEALLRERGKNEHLDELMGGMPQPGTIVSTRQQEPQGLGHAVWCARSFVGDEPFAVILPDDLVMSDRPCIGQLIEAWNSVGGGNVLAVEDVPRDRTDRYGILDIESESGRLARARGMVEKPAPAQAPSTLAVIGRYILDPVVMRTLEQTPRGSGGEIQLTDAIAATVGQVPLHGYRFEGTRFDCGDKVGFIEANIAFGLAREGMKERLGNVIKAYAHVL